MNKEEAAEVLKIVEENVSCDDCLYYGQMEDCPDDDDCIIARALEEAIEAIQGRKEGHWRKTWNFLTCSECQFIRPTDLFASDYCPNCGTKMRGEGK